MENVAFYREWLPLNKKEFRILAMLADFGGEYHGNLTDMCRYFSVSPQHKNREALREAIQHLTDRHYIESSVNGRTYSLRIIPKEKEIALPREWFERVRTREYSSESVSWEAVIKLLLWLIAHNPEVMITNQQIADDLDVSVSVVVSAKNVLEKDFEAITAASRRMSSWEIASPPAKISRTPTGKTGSSWTLKRSSATRTRSAERARQTSAPCSRRWRRRTQRTLPCRRRPCARAGRRAASPSQTAGAA